MSTKAWCVEGKHGVIILMGIGFLWDVKKCSTIENFVNIPKIIELQKEKCIVYVNDITIENARIKGLYA